MFVFNKLKRTITHPSTKSKPWSPDEGYGCVVDVLEKPVSGNAG